MMDKNIEAAADFIAGLGEQSAQGYIIQAQDEEIEKLKGRLALAVEALRYYADPENWPANSLFIHEDPHGWDIAQTAIAATEDE